MESRCLSLARRGQLLALGLLICFPQAAVAQDGDSECRTVATGLACEVFCVDGKPRDQHATISWKERSLPDPLTLELTVFKQGFSTGEVAVFEDLTRDAEPDQKAPQKQGRPAEYRGKDDRDLAWKDVFLIDEPDRAAVTLHNLEANLTYRFRLVSRSDNRCVQSEEATCRPAPCVVDWVEEDER